MFCLAYYKYRDRERFNLQRTNVPDGSLSNSFEDYAIYEIATWHEFNQSFREFSKDKTAPVIQDCGYEYPSAERNYLVIGTFKHEGKWSKYYHAKSRFMNKEEAEKRMQEIVDSDKKPLFHTKYSIKHFPYKRYPNPSDYKFTQTQIEDKVEEIYGEIKRKLASEKK